jgi:hypothetical protein
MRPDRHPTAAYLATLANELATLAENNSLTTLAYLFRMAEIEATLINKPLFLAKMADQRVAAGVT